MLYNRNYTYSFNEAVLLEVSKVLCGRVIGLSFIVKDGAVLWKAHTYHSEKRVSMSGVIDMIVVKKTEDDWKLVHRWK